MKRLFFVSLIMLIGATISIQAQDEVITTTSGAFQQYERGMMLWRADTEDIWVLDFDGNTSAHPIERYENIPDNPITDVPADTILPVAGFGRIWGNNETVRNRIGYAVANEVDFQMRWERVGRIGNGAVSLITNLPDGTQIILHDNNTWHYHPVDDQPQRDTLSIQYQPFENGAMVYDPETGMIYVLFENTGETHRFDTRAYGHLSLDPIQIAPPENRYRPILGFGKVWGHFPYVRAALGWATIEEYTYSASYVANQERIVLPDGIYLTLTR